MSFSLGQEAAEPADPAMTPRPGVGETMVRFVNAAPNTGSARIMLVDHDGVGAHEAVEVGYLETTEYMPVFEGSFDVVVEIDGPTGEPTQRVLDERFGATQGMYVTVALIGLVMPEDEADTDDGGFFGWLQDLFTDDRPELGLRALVLEDHTAHAERLGNVEVRLLHAAPGTDAVDLVIVHEDSSSVLETASYGEATAYGDFPPGAGTLQVRATGSDLVIVDLPDVELSEDLIHTVVLAGTPIEDVPLEAVVLSGEWIDPMLVGPGAATMHGAMTPEATVWVLDYVMAAEARLDLALERLTAVTQVEAAEQDAREAAEAVQEARELLHEARIQLETFTTPGAVPPATPEPQPAAPDQDPAPEDEPADEPAQTN